MRRSSELLEIIKKYLKVKGITYRHLANEMGLSETSIKRLFANNAFSLERLEKICQILDLDLFDLVVMARQQNQNEKNSLTPDQEQALADDPKLMSVFYFLINGWSVDYIVSEYQISKEECTRMLIRLDRLGLIELHADNRVRLKVAKNVFWQKDGPLWRLYYQKIMEDFMAHRFESPKDRLLFSPGVLSEASMKIILKQIDRLFKQYNELAEMDSALPLKGRYSAGLFIAFRPWVFSMLAELRKQKSSPGLSGKVK